MDNSERTRDLYEQIEGYPKPPLIPLPEPGGLDIFENVGVRFRGFLRGLARLVEVLSGFRAFQKRLPENLESLLRTVNVRGPGLFSPVISATLTLREDPKHRMPLERAASLILGASLLRREIMSATFEPDRYREHILEMGQYPNLFSTSIIFDGKKPRLFKSNNFSQILVVVDRQFFIMDLPDVDSEDAFQKVVVTLEAVVRQAQSQRPGADDISPGYLTVLPDGLQRKIFPKFQRVRPNAESLKSIRHTMLTLCLDLEETPSSDAEAAHMAHVGNMGNRWYYASLQLVVFGNASACMICNFSAYLDGNVMMRAGAELYRRAAGLANTRGSEVAVQPLPFRKLEWRVRRDLFRLAQSALRFTLDNQKATYVIEGIGREFFERHGSDPVAVFVLALQMTADRLCGRRVKISQFLAMSRYRCMDLATIVVSTEKVYEFVDYARGDSPDPEGIRERLQSVVASQKQVYRKERAHLPVHRVFALFLNSRKGLNRIWVLFLVRIVAVLAKRMGVLRQAKREVLISHPRIYDEISIVGRPGVRLPYLRFFGLHYQIFEDRIVITMMPGPHWSVPNGELIQELKSNLLKIQSLLTADKKKTES